MKIGLEVLNEWSHMEAGEVSPTAYGSLPVTPTGDSYRRLLPATPTGDSYRRLLPVPVGTAGTGYSDDSPAETL